MDVIHFTACSHDAEAPPRLERANQNQPTPGRAFHEHVEHPVHTVIHVNVDCPRRVSIDERAGARPRKGVGRFVVQCEIGLCLDDDARTFSPKQLGAHELACTDEGIALEKGRRQNPLMQPRARAFARLISRGAGIVRARERPSLRRVPPNSSFLRTLLQFD
jgi:hypothetical protein